MDRIDDTTLVQRCRDGDETAWRQLIRRHRSLVYTMALRAGLDEEEAGEVFQLVWTELHRSLGRLRDPRALPGWLAVATRRISYRRAMERAKWVEGTFDEMIDPASGPDDDVETLDLRRRLEDALSVVGPPCSTLIPLLFFHSPPLSYPEVAKRAGMPRGSIGPTRGRCLARLNEVMRGDE